MHCEVAKANIHRSEISMEDSALQFSAGFRTALNSLAKLLNISVIPKLSANFRITRSRRIALTNIKVENSKVPSKRYG